MNRLPKRFPETILESLKELFTEIKEIVSVAGTSPTSLTALIVLLLSTLVIYLFASSSEEIKVVVFLLTIISFLIFTLSLYRTLKSSQKRYSGTRLSTIRKQIHPLRTYKEPDIFPKVTRHLLEKKSRDFVLIYAPTGVWHPYPPKTKWFKEIGNCLARQSLGSKAKQSLDDDSDIPTNLTEFVGVYGLPFRVPREDDPPVNYSQDQLNGFSDILNNVEESFLPFNGLRNAKLYRLLIDARTVSGTGVIIFDDATFFGFSVGNRIDKVDYGIFFSGWENVNQPIERWFRTHVMKVVDLAHPIQDMDDTHCVDMLHGIDDIRMAIGLPRHHLSHTIDQK